MFWLTCVGFALAWVLVKFGVLSSTVSILSVALKLALVALACCTMVGGIYLLQRSAARRANDNTR